MAAPKLIRFFEVRTGVLLFVILALSFTLRLWGAALGLPYLYHADEQIVVNHALAFGAGDLNPHFFKIPPLTSYVLFFCYGIFYLLGRGLDHFQNIHEFEYLFYQDPSSFYLIGRVLLGALLGTATVLLLYRWIKVCWNKETALLASLFLAVNFLHARDSHFIYVDIPLLIVMIVSFPIILRISVSPWALKLHAMAGIMIGLAAATKYNGIFLALPYLWICLRTISWRYLGKFWCVAALGVLLSFFLFNPYAFLDFKTFLWELHVQSRSNTGGYPWVHHLAYSLAGAMGIPFLLFALLAVIRPFFSRDLPSQSLSIFVIGYYAVLCKWGQPYDRYVLPLIPPLCILSAIFLMELKAKITYVGPFLFATLFLTFTIPSAVKIVRWNSLMAEKDVRTLTKEWIESHIPAGSYIAMDGDFFMPRLAFSKAQLIEKIQEPGISEIQKRRIGALLARSQTPSYNLFFMVTDTSAPRFFFARPVLPFDINILKARGIQYILVSERYRPAWKVFEKELQKTAALIVRFTPFADASLDAVLDKMPLTGGPFLWKDISARTRNGYPIRVYKISH